MARLASGALPRVSVVIPCYNQAHYLSEAVESALSQYREGERLRCLRQPNRAWRSHATRGSRPARGSTSCSSMRDLCFRIARSAEVVCHTAVVAEYRHHATNMSDNGVLMLRSAIAVLERQWPYARRRSDYRHAYAAGSRFWREFYGDRVVEEIRAGVRGRGSAARAAVTLLLYAPGMAVLHLFRKLRVMTRRA